MGATLWLDSVTCISKSVLLCNDLQRDCTVYFFIWTLSLNIECGNYIDMKNFFDYNIYIEKWIMQLPRLSSYSLVYNTIITNIYPLFSSDKKGTDINLHQSWYVVCPLPINHWLYANSITDHKETYQWLVSDHICRGKVVAIVATEHTSIEDMWASLKTAVTTALEQMSRQRCPAHTILIYGFLLALEELWGESKEHTGKKKGLVNQRIGTGSNGQKFSGQPILHTEGIWYIMRHFDWFNILTDKQHRFRKKKSYCHHPGHQPHHQWTTIRKKPSGCYPSRLCKSLW